MRLPVVLKEHVSAIDAVKAVLPPLVAGWKVDRGITASIHILAVGIFSYFAIIDNWIKDNFIFSKRPTDAG